MAFLLAFLLPLFPSRPLVNEMKSNHSIKCNTSSLDVKVSYGGRSAESLIDLLYTNLTACTDVRSLSLTISQGGCEIDDANPRSFMFKKGDTFPPLENLTLSGYDWDSRRRTSWWAQTPTSLQSWRLAMDWSRLKHLDIDLPPKSFLEAFSGPDHLAGLETLVLRPRLNFWGDEITLCDVDEVTEQLRQGYTSFIATLPPLRGLSISGMGSSLDLGPILEAHGESLKTLSLHEYESNCIYEGNWVRPTLNITQLRHLSHAAPNLEAMALDLQRNGLEWPAAALKALSTFENLRDLTIRFDLENHNDMKPVQRCAINRSSGLCTVPALTQPVLDQTAAREIFREIQSSQSGKKLQHLTLYAGDYGREEGGGLRVFAHKEHNRPVKFECGVAEDASGCCKGWIGRSVDDGYDDPDDHDGYPKRIMGVFEQGELDGGSYSADFKEDQVFMEGK